MQGAAYGIQANVGPAKPGAEVAQGVMKGLLGAGLAQAGEAKMRAAAAGEDRGLAGKLAMLMARKESPAEAAAKAGAVAGAQQPYKLELQRQAGVLREQVAKAINSNASGLTAAQAVEMNNKVLDQVDQRFKSSYNYNPTADELQSMITQVKKDMLSGTKIIAKPDMP